MTMLGVWLKHLILLVLVSVIADLLLPTKAMQKYVRAVLGIAIIAAMIQPITPLFGRDWAERLASGAVAEITHGGDAPTVTENPGVLADYQNKLAQQEASEANELVAAAIAANIPASLRAHVQKITVTGAENRDQLRVEIELRLAGTNVGDEVRRQVASYLQVDVSRVRVQAVGGE